jgi:hypothetical protein
VAALCASVAVLCTGPLTGRGGRGGVIARGASPRLAARAAGSAAPASVGRAWNPIARTYSTLAKIIHTDHSYTHSVYGLYVEAPPLQNL